MTLVARALRWLGLALAAAVLCVLLVHAWYAACIAWWSSHPVGETSFMDYRVDELRAKRATVHALPIIERLVLALPPRDPVPTSGAVALPRRRRRR